MATTIQVSDATKQLLDILKKKEKARTQDELIQRLAKQRLTMPESMFGAAKGLAWKKQDRAKLHEL